MATQLERIVRPRLLDLRKSALTEWSRILDDWLKDDATRDDKFDTIRLERLVRLAMSEAEKALSKWDCRFSIQVTSSLPHSVIALACQLLLPNDNNTIAQVIRTMRAMAVNSNGVQWERVREDGMTAIALPPSQWSAFERDAPKILGRFIGACHLLVWSQNWYRWAGKGRKIGSLPEQLSQSQLDALDDWDGSGILLVPSVGLEANESIERAAAAYDSRRQMQFSDYSRPGLLAGPKEPVPDQIHRIWSVIPALPDSMPLPVHVPKLDAAFPSPNWYPIANTSWQGRIRLLGQYFDPQLKAKFDLSAAELELCLAALGLVIERHTQCGWLREGKWNDAPALTLSSPADATLLRGAVVHMVAVLQRGSLRNPRKAFRMAVSSELDHLGAQGPDELAHRFFSAFSGTPNPVGLSNPILFIEQDEHTCVHDLTAWPDFWDGLMSAVTAGDGGVGNTRGDLFESQVRATLVEMLSLTPSNLPFPANKDVLQGDTNCGDVDFCFEIHGFLGNLDMKSWQRTSDYHVGHFHTIQNRQMELVKQIRKAKRRGDALLDQMRAAGREYSGCVTFLIVATPEYLDPNSAELWLGTPPKNPRVITVHELCDLVSNKDFQSVMAEM